MKTDLWLIIIGMGIVTYLPKFIPFLTLKNKKLPEIIKRFLQYVIFAILGSLIFPGILTSTNNVYSAVAGGLCAIILSLFGVNITFIILGAISTVYIIQYI